MTRATDDHQPDTSMDMEISSNSRSAIRRKLLSWYDRNKRDLPWRRRTSDPYAQWVAEIMLQQTRVPTVITYYERFLRRFPDFHTLARAGHETVLKAWEGLGYYRRVLHLHQAVRYLHEQGLPIPSEWQALRRLPGVGPYTASAIASIAFRQKTAAVDGNVARILTRLFGVTLPLDSAAGKASVHHLAQQLLSPGRPGDFNQAWMDLGSEICLPRNPHCRACPLRSRCRAHQSDNTAAFPVRSLPRAAALPVRLVAVLFRKNGVMLVRRRPVGGLWSGLWELPHEQAPPHTSLRSILQRIVDDYGMALSAPARRVPVFRHSLTHRALTFYGFVCEVKGCEQNPMERNHRWITPRQFARLSVSTAHRRLFRAAEEVLTRLPHTPPQTTRTKRKR